MYVNESLLKFTVGHVSYKRIQNKVVCVKCILIEHLKTENVKQFYIIILNLALRFVHSLENCMYLEIET